MRSRVRPRPFAAAPKSADLPCRAHDGNFKTPFHHGLLGEPHRHLIGKLVEAYGQYKFTEMFNPFIVSFSEDGGNELSQWRAYAADGGGYSIGFDPQLLPPPRLEGWPITHLVRCVYGLDWIKDTARLRLRNLAERYVVATAPVYREGNHGRLYKSFVKSALEDAGLLIGRVKHGAFWAEREYRIVVLPIPEAAHESIEYRGSPRGLIPFIRLRMELRYTLRHVWVGPTQDPERGKAVATDFLGDGRPGLVDASAIPYTGR